MRLCVWGRQTERVEEEKVKSRVWKRVLRKGPGDFDLIRISEISW